MSDLSYCSINLFDFLELLRIQRAAWYQKPALFVLLSIHPLKATSSRKLGQDCSNKHSLGIDISYKRGHCKTSKPVKFHCSFAPW